MTDKIDKSAGLISRIKIPDLPKSARNLTQQADKKSAVTAVKPTTETETEQNSSLRSILSEISGGSEYSDDKSFKNFTHLARSLEKYFYAAETVDRQTGTKELQQGGLRRIDTDLRKLFKGLGVPPQQAKQLSRAIAAAIERKGVEQIDLPLSGSTQLQLETKQTKGTYLASRAGRAVASETRNSFQLAVISTKSLNVSLNLRNGGFTLGQTPPESLAFNRENAAALSSFFPLTGEATVAVAQPITELDEITALVNSDSSLQEISRVVKQSAISQLSVNNGMAQQETTAEELFSVTLDNLQQLIADLGEFTEQAGSVFESLLKISNLRTERKEEANLLLFTLEAQAPIGLTAVDATGHGTTLYPRPDGSSGKLLESSVKVTI